MLGYHLGRGATRFVVPLTVEMALSFKQNRHYFDQFGLPMFPLQLRCDEEILRRRVEQRDRLPAQKATELAMIHDQLISCKGLAAEFTVIETSSLDERATAAAIWFTVSSKGAAPANRR